MFSLRIFTIPIFFLLSLPVFASNEKLTRLRILASHGQEIIDELAHKSFVRIEDVQLLARFSHESGYGFLQIPSDRLVEPARALLVDIANEHPEVIFDYIDQNLSGLHIYQERVADWILTAAGGAPQMIQMLLADGLIDDTSIARALERAPAGLSLEQAPLSISRPEFKLLQKLRVAVALANAGVRSNLLTDVFIDATDEKAIATGPKIIAITHLTTAGVTDERAVRALRDVVLPPVYYVGATPDETANLRLKAVAAIGSIPLQASVDALWDIIELQFDPVDPSQPLPDTAAVVDLAKEERRDLMSSGKFADRSLTERAERMVRCAVSLLRLPSQSQE